MLHQSEHYAIQPLCQLFDLPRSSYYYPAITDDEQALRAALEQVASEFPVYGSRRLSQQLRRPPYERIVNRKRVQRLMAVLGLQRPVKRPKQQTTNSRHAYPRYPNLVMDLAITQPDQVGFVTLHT